MATESSPQFESTRVRRRGESILPLVLTFIFLAFVITKAFNYVGDHKRQNVVAEPVDTQRVPTRTPEPGAVATYPTTRSTESAPAPEPRRLVLQPQSSSSEPELPNHRESLRDPSKRPPGAKIVRMTAPERPAEGDEDSE